MSYGVTLFNVFIASPSDVNWARAQIRQSVQVWNEVYVKHTKSILFPLGWETNSAPNMGKPAQAQINEKLVSDADILVGVFWTRLGTPTESYDSGTVEEIELHISAGKPTLLYFSEEPVALASVDRDEYERLQSFKGSCKTRGLYKQFDSPSQFAEDFNRHLAMHVNELIGQVSKTEGVSQSTTPRQSSQEGLSEAAKILLKEASLDPHGHVMQMRYLGGSAIQTNGKNMITQEGPRETAKWEGAIRELVRAGLLVAKGAKGELFDITSRGYEVADSL